MVDNKKNKEIELLRFFATILVVLGHSGFYIITTSVSSMGCDWTKYILDETIIYKIIGFGTRIIYSCHMQLFILISGMVFQICLNGGKYKTVLGLLKNKIPRLIIPYFLVSILYNIPILWCSNYFGGSVYNVILYLIGFGKNHLWYLEALFIIFVLTYACNSILIGFMKIQKRTAIAVMMIPAVLMYLLNDYIKIYVTEIAYIDRVAKYWMWFLIGMFFVEFEDNIKRALKDKTILKISGVFGAWMFSFLLVDKGKRFFLFEEQIFGIFFWYFICYWIINRFPKVLNNRILKLINMYSMDIYLYGVPVNYIIMTMLIHIDDATHMNNITSLFLYVLRIFMQIIVGIAIPSILKKLKYCKQSINVRQT